jgi:hypothetical protein
MTSFTSERKNVVAFEYGDKENNVNLSFSFKRDAKMPMQVASFKSMLQKAISDLEELEREFAETI